MAWVGGIASVVTLVTIAIERYYAVMYPLGNKSKFTKRKLKVSLICNLFKFSDRSYSENSSNNFGFWLVKITLSSWSCKNKFFCLNAHEFFSCWLIVSFTEKYSAARINTHTTSYSKGWTLWFQVIIPITWIFSIIFYLPFFLVAEFDTKVGFCSWKWPEIWMRKAYSVLWLGFAVLPLLLMVKLYSRVVYTLWIKRCDDNQLTFRQRVSVYKHVRYQAEVKYE